MQLEIKIRKRSQIDWLMDILVILPLFISLLTEMLHIPDAIKYVIDVAWMVGLLFLCRAGRRVDWSGKRLFITLICTFLLYTAMVYLVQYQSVLYYLWGIRGNFRFYMAFLFFVAFLTEESVERYLKAVDVFFWINLAVSLIQFLGMGLRGDHLGGLFGMQRGCNQYTNILLLVVLAKSTFSYLAGKEKFRLCLAKFVASLAIAILAELKVVFVELVILVGWAVLSTNFSWKKVWITLGSVVGIIVGTVLLSMLFAGHARNWFTLGNLWEIVTSERGYTSSGDLNRLTAIPQLNERFLRTWWQQLFGMGLGNCDTSSFAFINTPFFEKYSYLHYSWFSIPMIYLETGYIGLAMFLGFFMLTFVQAWRRRKSGEGKQLYCEMGMIMSVMACLIALYNSSLHAESGYLVYFVLALPFIRRSAKENEQDDSLVDSAEPTGQPERIRQ